MLLVVGAGAAQVRGVRQHAPVQVLEPVRFDLPAGRERYPRSRVMEESEAIRTRIQDALYDMLSRRRSVWFG